ncbi:MAG: hypothetical protein H5U06_00760 [Candidatus Aminicenantes bacterium]|nr:hypothetical protein [Candidatus Aminicenantes bacterium]
MKKSLKKSFKLFVIFLIIIGLIYYLYCCFMFQKKVEIYNKRIQIGDSIDEVLLLMGKPTLYDDMYHSELNGDRAIRLIYEGKFYLLSEDIELIFDYKTRKLIQKERGLIFWRSFY